MTKNTETTYVPMPDTFRVLDAQYGAVTVSRIMSGERIGDWAVTIATGESEVVSEYHAYWAWKQMPAA